MRAIFIRPGSAAGPDGVRMGGIGLLSKSADWVSVHKAKVSALKPVRKRVMIKAG
jgi:hypothetical protein